MRSVLLLILVLQLAGSALATTPDEVSNPRSRGSWVTDLAGVLTTSGRDRIDRSCNDLQASNGTQMAVVVLRNTDRTPKAFATALFNRWGIGQKGLNNGVLVLVVMDQRRIEIEVGDGARHFLPDSRCAQILQSDVVPQFKARQPERGILAGVDRICGILAPARYAARTRLYTGTAPVADYANVLSAEIKANLTARTQALYNEHGVEMVIFIRPKNKSAEQEFRLAGLGSNGVMALLSTSTGQVDLCCGADLKKPELTKVEQLVQAKNWNQASASLVGLVEDASANLKVGPLSAESAPPQPRRAAQTRPVPVPSRRSSSGLPIQWLLVGVVLAATGGVYQWTRHRARFCPNCRTRKLRLDETSDDQQLNAEERLEERLGSVDYDAWLCPNCAHVHVERWSAWLSRYSNCPSCYRRTLEVTTVTLESATEYSSGRGRKDEDCKNCNHHSSSTYTIPRKQRSSSSSSSSGRSSSGSSGFGGGRSSGGGSGASW